MHAPSLALCLGTLAVAAHAIPMAARQASDTSASKGTTGLAMLPQNDQDQKARAAGVDARNKGFVYGPSLIGEAAPFPNGTLGNARTAADMAIWEEDRKVIDAAIAKDATAAGAAIKSNGGLKNMDDYVKILYGPDAWKNANPLGTAPGIMTNYTSDLLFSMERLSQNPYPLQKVGAGDQLPFEVDEDVAMKVAGASLADLQKSGKLFMVDHRYQDKLAKTTVEPKRYGAACTAYFFIHPQSNDFLPLAIKTNVGKDLVYTPQDAPEDWLLAKMMFNVNDMFHAQMFHLVVTHDVSEAVHQAALHTLSDTHPIMIMLERLMYQAYSSRIVGEQLCFNPGGHWDQTMFVNNDGCRQYVTDTWATGGRFQAGYLDTDFKQRGLLDDAGKSVFKSFPFYQDASEIQQGFHTFFTSFIDTYYASDADVAADFEVQNWFVEASADAKVQDFPQCGGDGQPKCDKATLVNALTHTAFIVSVVHHALNGGDPVGSKATLPFHLPALYAPVPDSKNVTDLLPFLPPPESALHYIGFIASFNRPFYPQQKLTLQNAFANDTMLTRFDDKTRAAAGTFLSSMQDLSTRVKARSFDSNGLSEGMPFVYRALDPDYIPFFCAV